MDKPYLKHGVLPAVTAACCFAVMSACVKQVSADLPTSVSVFLRNAIGLMFILPLLAPRGLSFLKTTRLKTHLLRSGFSLCAMSCYFFALGSIGLAEATLLNTTSPIFITILAILFLGEKLNRYTLTAIISGFAGVSLIMKPGTDLFTLGALLGLASGFFIACTKVLIRHMAQSEPVMRTLFYFSLLSTIYSAVPLLWFWQTPSADQLLIMTLAGFSGTIGQLLLTYSFTHNPAVKVAPFSYTIVLIAAVVGWLGWNELPDGKSMLGAILVISACLAMMLQGKLPVLWKFAQKTS